MRKRWLHAPELHVGQRGRVKRVTWLEIFYDLLFAAAFVKIGQGLAEGASTVSLLRFVVQSQPLFLIWAGFTFLQNRFDVDDLLHRSLAFAQMAAVGVMGAAAGQPSHQVFSLAAGAALIIVGLIYIRTYRAIPEARDYSVLWGLTFSAAGASWFAAGWTERSDVLLGAVAISFLAFLVPLTPRARALTERYPIDFHHIGKRYALLTLVILAQVFVAALPTLVSDELQAADVFEVGALFLLVCVLWWLYFDDVAETPLRPGPFGWVVWLYAHLPLQLAIVMLGAGVARAEAASYAQALEGPVRWLLAGPIALIFACIAAIDAVTERADAEMSDRTRISVRGVSALTVLLLAPAGARMQGGVFLGLLFAIALIQVVFDLMFAPYAESMSMRDERGAFGPEASSDRPGDMEIVRRGTPRALRRDLYFFFVEGSWLRVFVMFAIAFLFTNVLFAGLFLLDPDAISGGRSGGFADAFAFSVQTMSTIGFGGMTPGTPYGDVLVAVEAALTMLGLAIVTGFVVAKATRPRASVLFSNVMTVTRMNGEYVLAFRVGNARGNEVVDANVTVSALFDETTEEGHRFRRVYDIPLRRSRTPVFTLSWTVFHRIDESSPLWGVDWRKPEASRFRFLIVTLTGHDGTYAQTIYARHNYYPSEIRLDERFVDVLHELGDGRMLIDYTKFHLTEPDEPQPEPAPPQAHREEASPTSAPTK